MDYLHSYIERYNKTYFNSFHHHINRNTKFLKKNRNAKNISLKHQLVCISYLTNVARYKLQGKS